MSTCRHSKRMKRTNQPRTKKARQIVGISLDPQLALEFKTEAVRRNLSLKALFEEVWQLYRKQPKQKISNAS